MKSKQRNLELIFKICFIVYTMLSVCNFTYGKSIISYVMWPMMLLGAVLVMWRVLRFKEYTKMPGVFVLIAMSISFVLSMLINYQYGLKDNIVTFVLWIFYFFMLYTRNNSDNPSDIKKEFELIGIVYMIYLCVGNIVSILMMIVGYEHVYTNAKGYEVAAGFIWGRLWGVYIDPNFAAVMSTAAICLALYFWKKGVSKKTKVILGISIAINICFIAFTDSRTGRVCLAVFAIAYGLLWLLYSKKSLSMGKKLLNVLLILVVGVGAFYLPKMVVNGYNSMWNMISSIVEDSDNEDKKIDRGYDIEDDVSNRRFDIWQSGIEILETSPIFGVSFGGLRLYAEDNLPETYIVNNDYKDFNTLDNEILNVFVGQGLLGGIILVGFVVLVLVKIFKNIMKLDKNEFLVASTCFVIVICITASAMFRAAMFYHSSPNANVFWSFLGILVFYVAKKERESKNGCKN